MSVFCDEVILKVQAGVNIGFAAVEAINIAKSIDKTVVFKFNGVQIKLNKNSTLQCLEYQYNSSNDVKNN